VAKFKLVDIQDADVAEKLARTRRTELSPDMVVPARLERHDLLLRTAALCSTEPRDTLSDQLRIIGGPGRIRTCDELALPA
jgi:hypothetical protein